MADVDGLDGAVDDGREPCPICGFRAKNLSVHMRKHEANGSAPSDTPPPQRARSRDRVPLNRAPSVSISEETDRLVQSLALLSTFMLPVLPHTSITLMSRAGDRVIEVEGAKPIPKKGIATVVMGYAQRDPRVMRAVVRFNNLMTAGEGMELAMSLGAAVAVDAHLVDPHLTIAMPVPGLPGGMEYRPIEGLIGDVVAEVESRFPTEPGPEPAPEPVEAGVS